MIIPLDNFKFTAFFFLKAKFNSAVYEQVGVSIFAIQYSTCSMQQMAILNIAFKSLELNSYL